MGKGRDINRLLRPLERCSLQSYLGTGLHTLGLLSWIIGQTGPADVYVTTFSTSDAFLRGFLNLKKKQKITLMLLFILLLPISTFFLIMSQMKIIII